MRSLKGMAVVAHTAAPRPFALHGIPRGPDVAMGLRCFSARTCEPFGDGDVVGRWLGELHYCRHSMARPREARGKRVFAWRGVAVSLRWLARALLLRSGKSGLLRFARLASNRARPPTLRQVAVDWAWVRHVLPGAVRR